MEGKLLYVYLPVADMRAARTFYRDVMGLEEAWREGEETCAFKLPGTNVQLMLNVSSNPGGLVFNVPSVEELVESKREQVAFTRDPFDIPGGRWVPAKDASGNGLYFANVE